MNIDLNELFSVRNRSVVITGGASGIGFAVASTLTDRGANVTLLDRDRQKLESAVQNLSGREGKIRGAPCDVKDSGSLRREFDSAASKQGGIDIVFAIAGMRRPSATPANWRPASIPIPSKCSLIRI